MNNNIYQHPDGDPKKKRQLYEALWQAQATMKGLSSGNIQNSDYYQRPTVDEYTQDPDYNFDTEPEERKHSDLVNAVTKWLNEINDMGVKNKQWEVQEQTFDELAVDQIEQWNELQKMKKQQLEYISNLNPTTDPELWQQANQNLQKIDDQIRQLDQYFKSSDAIKNKSVLDLMYDRDRLSNSDVFEVAANNVLQNVTNTVKNNIDLQKIGESYLWGLKNMTWYPIYESVAKGSIQPLVEHIRDNKPAKFLGNYIADYYGTAMAAVKNLWNTVSNDKNAIINDMLTGQGALTDELKETLYRGNKYSKYTKSAVYDPSNISLNITDKQLKEQRDRIAENKKRLTTELELKQEEAKLGKVRLGIWDWESPTLWEYDTEVDQDWLKEDEEYNGLDPRMWDHWLASTASTVSFMRYQLPTMGAEAATMWALKKFGVDVILGSLPQGRLATLAKWLPRLAMAGAEVGTAVKSREQETAIEALEAYHERVVNDAQHEGADLLKVDKAITNELRKTLGETAANIPFDEKMRLGITMGVKTGDPVWDSKLITAQKGLMKLINENNTLAVADYLESLPFMPYSNAVISNALKKQAFRSTLEKSRNLAGKAMPKAEAVDRLWASNKTQDAISKSLLSPGGFVQTKIDKVAKKVIDKDLKGGLFLRDLLTYGINRAPLAFSSSIKEGIEEGQQELLQSRYRRGEYDEYSKNYSMLDFESGIADLELASDAIANYLGINYADLDNGDRNLRKAMNIGFSSSWLFGNARHAVTNIPGMGEGAYNITQLIKDFKSSNTIANLMADDYQKAQDYQHADLFLKALQKGQSAQALKDRLQFLKDQQYETEGNAVTQDMVDADKLLIDAVQTMYRDKAIKELAKEHGIKPSSEDFRFIMIDGATRIADVQKNAELRGKQLDEMHQDLNEKSKLIKVLLDTFDSEQGQQILANNPEMKGLYENFERMYEQVQKDREDAVHMNRLSIEKDVKSVLSAPQETSNKRKKRGKNLKEVKNTPVQSAADILRSRKQSLYEKYNISAAKQTELSAIDDNAGFVNAFVEEALRQTQRDIVRSQIKEAQDKAKSNVKRGKEEKTQSYEARLSEAERSAIINDPKLRYQIRKQVRKDPQFVTERQIRNEVNRRMLALANGELDGVTVDDLINEYVEGVFSPISKENYFELQLAKYWRHRQNKAIAKAVELSKNQEKLLSFVQKMTGLDLDTRGLKGMVETLETIQKQYLDRQSKEYESAEKDPFTNGEYNWDFDGVDDSFEKTAMSYFINTAMQKHQNALARAYKFAKGNPSELQEAIYGTNYDGDTEFGEVLKIQKEARAIIASIGDTEGREGEATEAMLKLKNAEKDAAWKLISTRMNESAKRSRIARREFLEDAMEDAEVGASTQDVDEVEQAVEQAEQEGTGLNYTESQKKIIEEVTGVNLDEQAAKEKEIKELAEKKKRQQQQLPSEDEIEEEEQPENSEPQDAIIELQPVTIQVPTTSGGTMDAVGAEITKNVIKEGDLIAYTGPEGTSIVDFGRITTVLGDDIVINTTNSGEVVLPTTGNRKYYLLGQFSETAEEGTLQQAENADTQENDDVNDTVQQENEAQAGMTEALDTVLDQQQQNEASLEQFYADQYEQENQQQQRAEQALESMKDWVAIKDFQRLFIDEHGNLCYRYPDGNSAVIPEDQANYIYREFGLLIEAENSGLSQNEIPMGDDVDDEQYRRNVSGEFVGNLLANTAFYTNDPDQASKSLADEGTTDVFNGVKLPKQIGTAEELSQNLSKEGWLQSTKKYYIVTKSNRIKTLKNPKGWRNAMVVALVIEDKDKCYLTFLRDLAKGEDKNGNTVDNQLRWMNWMQTKNADIQKIERTLGKQLPTDSKQRANAIATFIKDETKKRTFYVWAGQTGSTDQQLFDEWYEGHVTGNQVGIQFNREALIRSSRNLVLRSYSIGSGTLMSSETIREQIEKLAKLRNDIINTYLGINSSQEDQVEVPSVAKTTVEPQAVEQSNGKIDNVRDKYDAPVFRKLDNSEDIDEITEKINSGKLLFGMGRGIRSKQRWKIVGLLSKDRDLMFDGKGLSGKIYVFVKSLTNRGIVPIMLSERKLNGQAVVGKDNKQSRMYDIQQTLLYSNGSLSNVSTTDASGNRRLPSIAEILFYMITHKFDFGVTDFGLQSSIAEFFIHHGKDTILAQQPDYRNGNAPLLDVLASKQISYELENDKMVLKIALPNSSGYGYTLTTFTDADLFDESTPERSANSSKNRQACIEAIANQMHWNTDEAHINTNINVSGSTKEVSQFVRHMMQIAEQNGDIKTLDQLGGNIDAYLNQSFNVMGCPDLAFTIKDFYKKKENRASKTDSPITARNVNTLAWMIKNGILVTDVSDKVFKDPFVFTFGVKGTAEKDLGPVTQKPTQPTEEDNDFIKSFVVSDEDKSHIVLNSDPNKEEKREKLLKQLQQKYPTIVDNVVISDSASWDSENIDQKLEEFVKKYESDHNIKFASGKSLNTLNLKRLDGGDVAVMFRVHKKEGEYTYTLQLLDTSVALEDSNTYITGVYKSENNATKRVGTLDTVKARRWLAQTLGISDYNIYVQRAAFLGASDEKTYGFTRIAIDEITGNITAKFGLSYTEGSKGVHYHEAWHYVNLLLHDSYKRQQIWDEFVKTHKQYKGKSYKEIEEAMADDFMEWVENKYGEGRFGIISKAYQSFIDFVDLVLRRNKYKKIYQTIKQGGYKMSEMNTKSIQAFLKNYQGVAYEVEHQMFQINDDLRKKLTSVNAYQDIYDGIDSIIHTTVMLGDIKDVKSAQRFVSKNGKINDILKDGGTIDDMIENIQGDAEYEDLSEFEQNSIDILKAIKENPDILKARLIQHFEKLGFKAQFKEQQDSATEKEDAPDNTWDKLELTVSKKMQATAQVKLFLSTIPEYTVSLRRDGTLRYTPKHDRFGQTKMWDFDKAWNVLANELNEVRSYGQLDSQSPYGGFAKNSLRGTIKRLSKTEVLFYALDAKLDKLEKRKKKDADYSEIKSQLFGVFNSNKNHIYTIDVQNPYSVEAIDLDSDEIYSPQSFTTAFADVDNTWSFSDDGVYNPAFVLPRTWSQSLASHGIRAYDNNHQLVISEQFADKISDYFDKLRASIRETQSKLVTRGATTQEIDDQNRKTLSDALYGNKGILGRLINLYNILGIPVDATVLYTFISTIQDVKGAELDRSPQLVFDGVKKIMTTTSSGSLFDLVKVIKESKNKPEFVTKSGKKVKTKSIDELYTGYHLNTHIAKLALSYSSVYPSLKELSSKSANGDTQYPINLNNFISDTTTQANQDPQGFISKKRSVPYNRHSILLQALENVDETIEESRLRLNTFVGMKKVGSAQGSDYLEIIPAEDYLCKLFMAENDNLPFPTMAGKKTYYSLSVGAASKSVKQKIGDTHGFNLVHDTIIMNVDNFDRETAAKEMYAETVEPYDEKKHGTAYEYTLVVREWVKTLDEDGKQAIQQRAQENVAKKFKDNFGRFSNSTINIFCGYFSDELDALIEYYDEDNVKALVQNSSLRVKNFHGKVKDGKLQFGGNGGMFRYFYDMDLSNVDKALGIKLPYGLNLNQKLQAVYNLQKQLETGTVKDLTKSKADVIQNIPQAFVNMIAEKNGDTDGFELVRLYLAELKKQAISGEDTYSPILRHQVNAMLIQATKEELYNLSSSESQVKLCKRIGETFLPAGIPEQFFEPYVENLRKLGRAGYKKLQPRGSANNNYGDRGAADALFSLIGSFVANTAIAVIETEKMYTGDPAYYKWSKAEKVDKTGEKVEVTQPVKIKLNRDGVKAEVTTEVSIVVETFTDKIKRLGGTLSPGTKLREDFSSGELEIEKQIIIQHLGEDRLSSDFLLNSDKYTVLEVKDAECNSTQLDFIREMFEKQALVDLIRQGEIKIENANEVVREIYDVKGAYEKYINKFKSIKISEGITVKEFVDSEVLKMSGPYQGINVADAQVFVRPMMYRNLRKRMGEWTNEDEEAFWILETDDSWMHDAEKSKKVRKFQLNALKMSYFGYDVHNITEGININKPLYNKMAIFPLFKFHRSTDVGRMLYDRMNRKDDVIDMIAFSSAVKVGGAAAAPESIDSKVAKESPKDALSTLSKAISYVGSQTIDYSTGEVVGKQEPNMVPISVQMLNNLRLQLNTKAHIDDERSMGTQLLKMAFQNILDGETYDGILGSEIKQKIITAIKKITEFGAEKVRQEFFGEDGNVDQTKVRDYLNKIIHRNGLGAIAEEIISNGNTIASMMSRDVFEQSLIKGINSEVIDINTNGGAAIQQSIFGFVGTDKKHISEYEEGDKYAEYNNGEELQWHNEHGATEVFLSIKFFKSMIPADVRQKGFQAMREWLMDPERGIIGKNSEPVGVGYRIPTQGMPSMFAMTVADVLPENTGDLIVVPREFTGQTGSDFDVDKIYITTLSFKDGKFETEEDGTVGGWTNALISSFITLISAKENFGQARGSIDTFTKILKRPGGVLDLVNSVEQTYVPGFKGLSPYFQTNRKMEFATGKNGIAPFALALANIALTQTTHLSIDFGKDGEDFNLNPLDEMYGQDHRLCSGWLSAMINAHVDVEKDPYVFSLNVNKATYSMAEFLIRVGKGESTFAFLSQPILKKYAQAVNSSGNIWGNDLYGDGVVHTGIKNKAETRYKKLYLAALKKKLELLNAQNPDNEELKKLNSIWLYFDYKLNKQKQNVEQSEEEKKKAPKLNVNWSDVISLSANVGALENLSDGSDIALAKVYAHQLLVMEAFKKLEKYADALSQLVQVSQIDTKKFGSTLTEQMLFVNKYLNFINGPTVNWIITTNERPEGKLEKEDVEEESRKSLLTYFQETFLYDKLERATSLAKAILKGQAVSASDQFESSFIQMMQSEVGQVTFDHEQFPVFFEDQGFGTVYKKEKALAIGDALQNLLRYRMFATNAAKIFEQLQDDSIISDFATLASGQHEMHISEYMRYLYFGNDTEGSIFQRLSNLIEEMKQNPKKLTDTNHRAFARLVDNNGNIQNDLLLYLQPILPTTNYPLGRMLLADTQMNVSSEIKSRYITAFYQLLQHTNPEIRKLAEDLVIFAYYSQYDQNAPGAFFDLVPYEYRQLYDKSLRLALAEDYVMSPEESDEMQDILARNYWYSDEVVPRHAFKDDFSYDPILMKVEGKALPDRNSFETSFAHYYDNNSRASFPGAIVTTKANTRYIKLVKNGQTYLYRNAGIIKRTNSDGKNGSDAYIYIAIPKAGIYTKGIKQFEFYANYEVDSIFEQNKLPSIFAEDKLRTDIQNWANKHNDIKGRYYSIEVKWGIDEIPETRMQKNAGAYKQVIQTFADNASGTIREEKEPYVNTDYFGQDKADVILNIVVSNQNGDKTTKNIKADNSGKVYNLVVGEAVNIEEFKKFVDSLGIEEDKRIVIHVTSAVKDGMFSMLGNEMLPKNYRDSVSYLAEQMIQQKIDEYKEELDADEEVQELEKIALLQKKETDLREESSMNKIRKEAARQYMYDWFNTVASSINSSGIPIRSYISFVDATGNGEITTGCISYNYANDLQKQIDRPVVYINKAFKSVNLQVTNSYKSAKYNAYNMFMKRLKSIYSFSTNSEEQTTTQEEMEQVSEKELDAAFSEQPDENVEKELEKAKKESNVGWARYSNNGYELSSAGDSRFSALKARFKEGTVLFGHDVGGRTIESVYQHGVKQGDWVTDNNNKTGAPKSKEIITGGTEDDSYAQGYLPLWQEWAKQNPELIEDLREKAEGKILTDKFAKTKVSQARAFADILNSATSDADQIQTPTSILLNEMESEEAALFNAFVDDELGEPSAKQKEILKC